MQNPKLGAFVALSLVVAVPSLAHADGARYEDRGRIVEVERLGPAASGRVAARLRFEGAREARVELDDTAIVRLSDGGEAEVERLGGALLRPLAPAIGLWLAADTTGGDGAALAERLSHSRGRGVTRAVPNLWVHRRPLDGPFVPNDPRYGGQWYFENIGIAGAWELTTGSPATSVVVVDTGCDMEHVDLVDKLDEGRDVVDDDDDPSPDVGAAGAAHGTQCAGIIGATTNNGEGIAGGCPECRLRCVRMLDDAPQPLSIEVEAFQFALDVDASVVSNSWGYVEPMPIPGPLEDIIAEVATSGRGGRGAIVVFAAGNDDREIGVDEVCGAAGVVCVGAINNFDESTPFTNFGVPVDVVAPTGTITTDLTGAAGDDPTDYTSLFGGTSSACPVVASVAGLLVSAAPEKTAAEVEQILVSTTRAAPYATPDASGHDPVYGYGIVDPTAALEVALGITEGTGGAGGGDSSSGSGGGETGGEGCDCTSATSSSGAPAGVLAMLGLALGLARRRVTRASR